jgi:hypothetical protein
MLAGMTAPDEDVRELVGLVDEPTRGFSRDVACTRSEVVSLTIKDRERILGRSMMSARNPWPSFGFSSPSARMVFALRPRELRGSSTTFRKIQGGLRLNYRLQLFLPPCPPDIAPGRAEREDPWPLSRSRSASLLARGSTC